jgi:hypothetical protein
MPVRDVVRWWVQLAGRRVALCGDWSLASLVAQPSMSLAQ